MNINELKSIFKEIRLELENPINRAATKNYSQQFDYDNFIEVIDNYLSNIELIIGTDEELKTDIIRYSQELLKYLVDGTVGTYTKKFLTAGIFLQKHDPLNYPEYYTKKDTANDDGGLDFSFMPEAKIKKLEEERLISQDKMLKLEKRLDESESSLNELNDLLSEAKDAQESFQNAKDAALKNLSLKESYKYWEEQAVKYSKKYIHYLWISLGLTSILIFGAIYIFYQNSSNNYADAEAIISESKVTGKNLLSDNNTSIEIKSMNATASNKNASDKPLMKQIMSLFHYALIIFSTTMIIWIIKIMMKITLSNYHLSIDANERVVMIKTYLSLIQEGSSYDNDDKKVILDNIFRPTNFGIIKDETSLTIADIVSSFKK